MKNNDKMVNILIFPNFVLQNILSALSSGTLVGSALKNVACITAGHLGIAKRIRVGTRFKQSGVGEAEKKISCSQSLTAVPQVDLISFKVVQLSE